MIEVKFKKEHASFELPEMKTEGAACYDLAYCGDANIILRPGVVTIIPLGFSVEFPKSYEMQLRPRSGLALKQGVAVINSPATIDSDYRDEVAVLLIKLTPGSLELKPGDRVCQMLISKLEDVTFTISEKLSESGRGKSGFGSTGV